MKHALLALALGALAGAAFARLPPPTPEEQAKLEKQAAAKKAQTERQKALLERAQERVARRYRERHAQAGGGLPAQALEHGLGASDVPKSAKQPLGSPAHPYAGRKAKPQGQAHSAGGMKQR